MALSGIAMEQSLGWLPAKHACMCMCQCSREWLTSHDEHNQEDDRQPPEGDRHRLDGKVLHVIQLLRHNKMTSCQSLRSRFHQSTMYLNGVHQWCR